MITTKRAAYSDLEIPALYEGLSTELKPLENVYNGDIFKDIDTGTIWHFDEQNNRWLNKNGEIWTPPAVTYTLKGKMYKYGAWYNLTVSLYRLKEGGNPATKADYETSPAYTATMTYTPNTALNFPQEAPFTLTGEGIAGHYYRFLVESPGQVYYEHLGLNLTIENTDGAEGEAKTTWTIKSRIDMIPGDIDGDGIVQTRDLDIVNEYAYRNIIWYRTLPEQAESDPTGWAQSVYNPDSLAYYCDLDGNASISTTDSGIVQDNLRLDTSDNVPFPGLMSDI